MTDELRLANSMSSFKYLIKTHLNCLALLEILVMLVGYVVFSFVTVLITCDFCKAPWDMI